MLLLLTKEWQMQTYYDPNDLGKFSEIGKDAPDLAAKFFDYYGAVFAEGELTEREKALIALAVAHTVQCPYCIDAYTRACLEKGSNLGEMTEAVQWKVAKPVTAALAYKYADVKGGTLSTGNGTIGSSKAGFKGTYNEIGLWFSYDF
jgi:alkylhydroperoxidase/carboxymuconolactone decarboxylase family protein